MAITRAKKEEIVRKVKGLVSDAKSLVFIRFHGLPVSLSTELRRKFREAKADYMVVKKKLLKIALKESGKEIPVNLDGEIAFAAALETRGADELAPYKTSLDFAKKHKELFAVVGGFFGGEYVDEQKARMLGAILSRESLIVQLMNVLQSNTRNFLNIIDQLGKSRRNVEAPGGQDSDFS